MQIQERPDAFVIIRADRPRLESMPNVIVRGPWSRRHVLGWTAGVAGVWTALKLAIGQEANSPSAATPDVAEPTHTPRAPRSAYTPPYTPRLRRVIEVAQSEAFGRNQPAFDQ